MSRYITLSRYYCLLWNKPCRKGDDLSQVCLQAVLGITGFWYAVGEGYVDIVELVPHFIGSGVQQDFYLIPELVGGSSLALGMQDVVICKLGPRVRQRDSDRETVRCIYSMFQHSHWFWTWCIWKRVFQISQNFLAILAKFHCYCS